MLLWTTSERYSSGYRIIFMHVSWPGLREEKYIEVSKYHNNLPCANREKECSEKIALSQNESELGRPGISFLTLYVAVDFQGLLQAPFPTWDVEECFIRKERVSLHLALAWFGTILGKMYLPENYFGRTWPLHGMECLWSWEEGPRAEAGNVSCPLMLPLTLETALWPLLPHLGLFYSR